MAEAFEKNSEDFNLEGDFLSPSGEAVRGPILPCVIGMCGSGVGFMKVTITVKAFSPLEFRFQRSWVRILLSAEGDNWSSFVSLPCCQCITINSNKHVYRQSEGWRHIGNGVEWTGCSLFTGTSYCVLVLVWWSPIAQSVYRRAFSLLKTNRFQRPWVRKRHPSEKDNWSPFDSMQLPCCHCIKININNHQAIFKTVYPHLWHS